jgi:hypothetical protein
MIRPPFRGIGTEELVIAESLDFAGQLSEVVVQLDVRGFEGTPEALGPAVVDAQHEGQSLLQPVEGTFA